MVAEEKKEEVAAPPAEDTGDVDDLVCILGFLNVILKQMLYFSVCVSNNLRGPLRTVITSLVLHLIFSLPVQLDMM